MRKWLANPGSPGKWSLHSESDEKNRYGRETTHLMQPLSLQCVDLAVHPVNSHLEHGCLTDRQTNYDLSSAEHILASGQNSLDHWPTKTTNNVHVQTTSWYQASCRMLLPQHMHVHMHAHCTQRQTTQQPENNTFGPIYGMSGKPKTFLKTFKVNAHIQ